MSNDKWFRGLVVGLRPSLVPKARNWGMMGDLLVEEDDSGGARGLVDRRCQTRARPVPIPERAGIFGIKRRAA
jgi:hypothetical protein